MNENVKCNLCGKDDTEVLIGSFELNLVKCRSCGLVYRNPRLSEAEEVDKIRNGQVPSEHKREVWATAKLGIFNCLLDGIEARSGKGELLDVGCGYGVFLNQARKRGWGVSGLEISGPAIAYARDTLGLNITECALKRFPFNDGSFDAVTLLDVLSLLYDPGAAVSEAARVLKPGGWLAMRAQNSRFHLPLARLFLRLPWLSQKFKFKPTIIHTYSFSPETLRRMLLKHGFTDISITVSGFTRGDPYSSGGFILSKGAVSVFKFATFLFASLLYHASAGKLNISPSMLVFARKPQIRKKVLHIITRMDKGGSAQNTLITACGTDKGFFEASLICGKIEEENIIIKERLSASGVKVYEISQLSREISLIRDFAAFLRIYGLVRKGRYDIVHTHTSKAGILGRWAAKLAGAGHIVHTPHGHVFYGYFGRIRSFAFILIEKATALITDKIITLTRIGMAEHIKYGIAAKDKFIPIYSGICLESFRRDKTDPEKLKGALGVISGVPVIGSVIRLEQVKGGIYLIRALKYIKEAFPNVVVLIIGGGTLLAKFRDEALKLGVKENLRFAGVMDDIAPALSLMDLFIMPSLNEGMGRSLLEAQAMAVPVVATSVGGIPEIVNDGVTGILVPPKDPQAIADAVKKLLQDGSLRSRMGQAALKWVDEKFSAEKMVKEIDALYRSLLHE